jgi:hypothetical protein
MIESERTLQNVPGLAPEQIVVIKKLGYAALSQLRSKSVNAKLGSNMRDMDANIDLGQYHKWIIVYGVKSAPFFASCITVDDRSKYFDSDSIPAETGEFLFKEIQKFNGFAAGDDLKKE